MQHVIKTYNNSDELVRLIEWKSIYDIEKAGICGILTTYIDARKKKYVIPEGVTTLSEYVFFDEACNGIENFDVSTIEIPASLIEIQDNALSFLTLKDVKISSGNTSFVKIKNALYTADKKRLIYIFTKGELIEEFVVPEGTEEIDSCIFDLWNIEVISIPRTVRKIGAKWMNNEFGIKIKAAKGSYAEKYAQKKWMDYIEA